MSKSMLQLKVLTGLLMALAGNAYADTYTNVPAGANNGLAFAYFGNAANPSGDSPKVGEVFSLTTASTLSSFSFYALGNVTASVQLNVALSRTFKIREHQTIQLRSEAFNLPNKVNLANPTASRNSSNFGLIQSDNNGYRVIQMAMKYVF